MQKYRKKPVVIDAIRFTGKFSSAKAIRHFTDGRSVTVFDGKKPDHLLIETLEGAMRADPGDWIIKGVAGEVYPIKNEIFLATYEPVEVPQ